MPKRKSSPKKQDTKDPKRKRATTKRQENDGTGGTGGLCSAATPGPSGISNSNEEESVDDFLARLNVKQPKLKPLQLHGTEPSSSLPEDPLDPDVKKRMDFIDDNTKSCAKIIERMGMVLPDTAKEGNPKDWREELDQLNGRLTLPTITIAVIGATGVGKSSLLNALVGFRDLLPTSDTQSCTAVVVRVTINSNKSTFEADVEFLKKDEWEEEVKQLLDDLKVKDDQITNEERDIADTASSKLVAVYGEIQSNTTFEDLQRRDSEVVRHLGQKEKITTDTIEEFKRMIHPYIKSNKNGSGFWPIIKQVDIRIPDCGVCSSGATLVDLPGGNDSNTAREKTAKEFFKDSDAVWVVSGSERAVSDQTGWRMLDFDMRRDLLMDGKYGSLAFVCTKTDTLDAASMDSDIKLPDEVERLEADISGMEEVNGRHTTDIHRLDQEIQNLEKNYEKTKADEARLAQISAEQSSHQNLTSVRKKLDSQKRAQEKQLQDMRNQKQKKEAEAYELEKTVTEKRNQAHSLRRDARNQFIAKKIRNNFRRGHQDMLKTSNDDATGRVNKVLEETINHLPVYCVSADQYMIMKTNANKHRQTFSSKEETQVPALKKFVHDIATQRRRQEVERLMLRTGAFVSNVQGDLITKLNPMSGKQIEKIKRNLDQHMTHLQKDLEKAVEKVDRKLTQIIADKLASPLHEGVGKAVKGAEGVQARWANISRGGYKWMTYRATCRREGEFKSREGEARKINFNMDLCRPIYISIAEPWGEIFTFHYLEFTPGVLSPVPSTSLMEFLKQFKKDVLASVDQYFCRRREASSPVCSEDYIQSVNQQGKNNATSELEEAINNVWNNIKKKHKDIQRNMMEDVKKGMLPAYRKCTNQRKKGMFKIMTRLMEQHVLENKDSIFKNAALVLEKKLKSMQKESVEDLKKCLIQVTNKLGMTDVSLGDRRQELLKRQMEVEQCSDMVTEMYKRAGVTDIQMLKSPVSPVPSSSTDAQM